MQARELARPGFRECFAAGDGECYRAAGGAACTWAVAEAGAEWTRFQVTLAGERGERRTEVCCPALPGRATAGGLRELFAGDPDADLLCELFAGPDPAGAWARARHCLDLWDWEAGRAVAAEGPGAGVVVRPHEAAGTWLVGAPAGDFLWRPAAGRNLVAPAAPGAPMPPADYLSALFVRPPE